MGAEENHKETCQHGQNLTGHLLNMKWEIRYLSIFKTSVKKIQVSLKSDKNNDYFTWTPVYIFDNIWHIYSQDEKRFSQKL